MNLYTNNLKNREFDKEAPQNFCLERATIAERQGASEDENSGVKLTQSKTDSSGYLCIQPNQIIELHVERLGINGEGVAHFQGLTVFVDDALPGERVKARIYEKRKTFARAKLVEILEESKERVAPICPLFGTCGGCQIMHLKYEAQLGAKRQRVVDALERIGKIDGKLVADCRASPLPLFYRNKIQLPVKEGKLGLYARHSHELVPIEKCYIHCALGEAVFEKIAPILKQENLKHVLIKTAVNTGEVLVVLVTRDEEISPGLAARLMKEAPEIKGVVQNVNPDAGNVVLSQDFRVLAGQGSIEEKIHGLIFKVSPASFFQINPAQAENLYQQVVEDAELTGSEAVLDAYCGVGTLALILAKSAKEVIGIENVQDATRDAAENALANGIVNARFICGEAEVKIQELEKVDVAVLNPPRKGCERVFLEALIRLKPRRIVYVSCDPATLARDLQLLVSEGYQVDGVKPFDMFPQTSHVESVAKLTWKGL